MNFLFEGIGKVLSKVMDYTQGRSERRRNEIKKLQEEMNEIVKKPPTVSNTRRYGELSARLSKLKSEAANACKD